MDQPIESTESDIPDLEGYWREAIETADTERELMSLARDYVAAFSRTELEDLPVVWKPGRLRSARDVSLITFRLAQAYCRPRLAKRHERCMRPLLTFFQTLSGRLFAVRARAPQL